MVRPLVVHQDYTCQEAHAIFAPSTRFTPQAGTWGLQGIVPVPDRPGDFVFFVTFGQEQGDHVFDEGITADGVLSRQSQPRQDLGDRQIGQLIAHDALHHAIYLFLRTGRRGPYTYLGQLQYLTHDPARERPVHFQWQLLDWPVPAATLARMGLRLQGAASPPPPAQSSPRPDLELTPPPVARPWRETPTPTFRARKVPDHSARDARNRQLGLAGELLVMAHERRALHMAGRDDLAELVRHVALTEGDGAGYDVASFTPDGTPRYIEVKTTAGSAGTPFYITSNEVAFAAAHAARYALYRVYECDEAAGSGKVYVVEGAVAAGFALTPTQFRATRR